MKKVSLLLTALALVIGLSQCKKPNLPVLNIGETQHVVINASWDNGGAKIDQDWTKFKWTIDDILTVSGGATGNLKCTDVTDGTFKGDITRTSGEKVIFTFKSENYKSDYMEQTGALNDAVSLTGEAPYSAVGKYDVSMTMPHAVLKLDLSALGTADGTPVNIKVVGGGTVASVKNVKNDEASKALYVAVPASPAGKQYEFVSIIGTARCDDVWALKENTFYTLKNGEGEAIVVKPTLLPGKFSVSRSEYVQFSRGNLWYNTSENSWNLEANQTDFAKEVNVSHISHFYHCKGGSYGSALNYDNTWNIHEDVDWGVPYNAQHGGSLTTLSTLELNYILKERIVNGGTGIGNTCQFVTVNGTKGLIIYPDEYSGTFFTMEQEITDIPEVCVFLPVSGRRESTITELNGGNIKYWLSTSVDGGAALLLLAYPKTTCRTDYQNAKSLAYSVRLVQKFEKPDFEIEFIDLGLPSGTLWANANVGAKSETDYGEFYHWGALEPSYHYSWEYAPFNGGNAEYDKASLDAAIGHGIDENYHLTAEADVATVKYGGSSHIPTPDQFDELLSTKSNGDYEWTYYNGTDNKYKQSSQKGWLITYKKGIEGKNQIFIPRVGYMKGDRLVTNNNTYYWASHCHTNLSCAVSVKFESAKTGCVKAYSDRQFGLLVRAVKPRPVPAGFVDLGLSVFWAESNLDGYYQFGATTQATGNGWNTTPYYQSGAGEDESWVFLKYNTVGAKLEASDDAAAVVGKGRIPSVAEWDELKTECTWTWNGSGFTVKSDINGNSIDLPANGNYGSFVGERGYYWANEVGGNNFDAHHLYFGTNEQPGAVSGKWNNRKEAFGIRSVHD